MPPKVTCKKSGGDLAILAWAVLTCMSLVLPPRVAAAVEMIALDGGSFLMGSQEHYREEGPVRRVTVGPFRISKTEITNADFAEFVAATGYVTTAERALDPAEHPDWPGRARVRPW